MINFLNNLKLFTKLNITTAISAISMILATIMFYIITNIFFDIIDKNNQSKADVQQASNSIINLLHQIDYLTIHNAITKRDDYKEQSKQVYTQLSKSISQLEHSAYLKQDKEAQEIIKKIKTRIQGYKVIASSLPDEVQEDSTDGLYAIMALSSASQRILLELEILNQKIDAIAKQSIKILNRNIFYVKGFSIAFITLLFAFLLYTNKLILSSILTRIELLKEEILSFFALKETNRCSTYDTKWK